MSSPNSQIAQNVLDRIEKIFQDVRRNSIQAYIKCKAHYYKKTNTSELRERDYDFRWVGPYIVENASSNYNYLVRKIGTVKT